MPGSAIESGIYYRSVWRNMKSRYLVGNFSHLFLIPYIWFRFVQMERGNMFRRVLNFVNTWQSANGYTRQTLKQYTCYMTTMKDKLLV